MYLIECVNRLHGSVFSMQKKLFLLVSLALFVFVFFALPITLTGLEDNVDGLGGYVVFFAALTAALALAYAAICYGYYRLSSDFGKSIFITLGVIFILLSFAFGFFLQPEAGVLDNFKFASPEVFDSGFSTVLVDLLVVFLCMVLAVVLLTMTPVNVANGLIILSIGSFGAGAYSLHSLHERINKKSEEELVKGAKLFNYSKSGKNVLLLFVDGAMSGYIPDILREDPHLAKQLSGFTWYSNVISTGNRTINGLPSLFGGFDYTVSEINNRAGDSLKDKVSDAYKIYVENFSAKNYNVLYSDPFWFGFSRKGDCELFNGLYEKSGQGRCIHSIGKQISDKKSRVREGSELSLFAGLFKQYGAITIFKISPQSLKKPIYGDGEWMGVSYIWKKKEDKYLNNYFSLDGLGDFSAADSKRDTFTFITNELTRAPLFLGKDCLPDHRLSVGDERFRVLLDRFRTSDTTAIYLTTKCTLQALGKYMEWFKANGLYDNTMIAIASDHGWVSHNPILANVPDQVRYSMFQSFLLFKDFGAPHRAIEDLKESKEFIANANVPGMLCEHIGGCLDKTTGKTIKKSTLEGSVLLHETPWQPSGQKPSMYVVEALYRVKLDITKPENWEVVQAREKP